MITAFELEKAQRNIEEAQRITKSEMPEAKFVFVGLDNEFVYFNVVAKLHKITESQVTDICEKTRFIPIEVWTTPIYKGQFKMRVM